MKNCTHSLVAALAGALLCTVSQAQLPFGNADDVAFASALWQALNGAKLAGPGAVESRPYPGQHPHGAVLQVFAGTLTVGTEAGAVIVKRNYGGDGVSVQSVADEPERYLVAVTVMFKRLGYDPENGNWFWARYRPDGALDKNPDGLLLAGRVASCITCHEVAPGGDKLFWERP